MTPRIWLVVGAVALLGGGCGDASGVTTGGDPRFDPSPPTTDQGDASVGTGSTWTDLYRDYFGPTGQATCSKNGGDCHGTSSETGAIASGYVCGATKDACYTGIAGGAVFPIGGTQTPDQTVLLANLRKAPPLSGGTMPKLSAFAFTNADLQRIRDWLKAGAPNN